MENLFSTKRHEYILYLFWLIGFILSIFFLPKSSLVVAIDSLILMSALFVLFLLFNSKRLSQSFNKITNALKLLFVMFAVLFLCTITGTGYLLAINHLVGHKTYICEEGTIINKASYRGKHGNVDYFIDYKNGVDEQHSRVSITLREYQNYEIGNEYEKTWIKGTFNYIYLTTSGHSAGSIDYKGCPPPVSE